MFHCFPPRSSVTVNHAYQRLRSGTRLEATPFSCCMVVWLSRLSWQVEAQRCVREQINLDINIAFACKYREREEPTWDKTTKGITHERSSVALLQVNRNNIREFIIRATNDVDQLSLFQVGAFILASRRRSIRMPSLTQSRPLTL